MARVHSYANRCILIPVPALPAIAKSPFCDNLMLSATVHAQLNLRLAPQDGAQITLSLPLTHDVQVSTERDVISERLSAISSTCPHRRRIDSITANRRLPDIVYGCPYVIA